MFQERIRRVYPYLPPSHQVIADFLLNRYQDAAFMSGSQLAQRLQVDAATVVRFSQRLGYTGYPELRHEIQERVRREIQARYQPLSAEEPPEELFRRIIRNECELLAQMVVLNATAEIDQLVERLTQARHIYLLSGGVEAHLAALFADLLRQQNLEARMVPPGLYTTAEALLQIESGDVALGIVLHNDYAEIAAPIRLARERGAFTVALVDNPSSELARMAEQVITCPRSEASTTSRFTCALVILLAIVQMLQVLHPETGSKDRVDQLQQTIATLESVRREVASSSYRNRLG